MSNTTSGAVGIRNVVPADATGTIKAGASAVQLAGLLTGTVALSSLTYGGGGSVDGLTLIVNGITCTFAAPANAAAIVSQLVAACGAGCAALGGAGNGYLVVAGVTGGTARTALGLPTAAYSRIYSGGVSLQNTDSTNGAWIGPAGVNGTQVAAGYWLAPGTAVNYPAIDIGTLWAYAPTGTPVINWFGVDLA